jgi:hypothetical protein
MSLMMWIAHFAGLVCVRFTALYQYISNHLGSTLLTSNLRHAALTSTYTNGLDRDGTLTARALKGAHSGPLTRIARGVAIVIGISLSIPMSVADSGSIPPYRDLKSLAKYQLTYKQFKCHNQIVFRESTWRADARNGSHYGYYQIRNTRLIGKPYDYQFYFYWKYVSHRYGITEYDEPDYCVALNHLITRGWQ